MATVRNSFIASENWTKDNRERERERRAELQPQPSKANDASLKQLRKEKLDFERKISASKDRTETIQIDRIYYSTYMLVSRALKCLIIQ